MENLVFTQELAEEYRKQAEIYVNAVGNKQYELLAAMLHPQFHFHGPIRLSTTPDYIQMLKEHSEICRGNVIRAIFVDGNDACVIYDLVTASRVGIVPCMENLVFREGKIVSTHLRFDRTAMQRLRREVAGEDHL
jgi:hypothetical protein